MVDGGSAWRVYCKLSHVIFQLYSNQANLNYVEILCFASRPFCSRNVYLAKVGAEGISSNLATAVRIVVILFIAWEIVLFSRQMKEVKDISRASLIFLYSQELPLAFHGYSTEKHLKQGMFQRLSRLTSLAWPSPSDYLI